MCIDGTKRARGRVPSRITCDELYSASMMRNGKKYIYRRANGRATVLKDVISEVQLSIRDGVYGLVMGHTHISFSSFHDSVPGIECFVSLFLSTVSSQLEKKVTVVLFPGS